MAACARIWAPDPGVDRVCVARGAGWRAPPAEIVVCATLLPERLAFVAGARRLALDGLVRAARTSAGLEGQWGGGRRMDGAPRAGC